MEEFLKDDERRWKKQSLRVGVIDGQAGQLNQELIMLLLKFQIPRLGEWLIAQGYINCLEKNQWLCTFRLCENIYSYMWKHRFGKGGGWPPVPPVTKSSHMLPANSRTRMSYFIRSQGYTGVLCISACGSGSHPYSTSSCRCKLLNLSSPVKEGYALIAPSWLW